MSERNIKYNNLSNYYFKYKIIGNTNAGKSYLLIRFTDDIWSERLISIIVIDYKGIKLNIDGKTINLDIWDITGRERFRNDIFSYYRDDQK